MLRKDDVVYYKVQLEKLFKQAKDNGITIELDKQLNCVSFSQGLECASAYINERGKRATLKVIDESAMIEKTELENIAKVF